MSFRKIIFGILTIWLALMGITFGALFVICVSLYLLWHGLSMSAIVFGGLCAACIALAGVALRRATVKDRIKLSDAERAELADRSTLFFSDGVSESRQGSSRRHKIG
jgi:hypothetical protein